MAIGEKNLAIRINTKGYVRYRHLCIQVHVHSGVICSDCVLYLHLFMGSAFMVMFEYLTIATIAAISEFPQQ